MQIKHQLSFRAQALRSRSERIAGVEKPAFAGTRKATCIRCGAEYSGNICSARKQQVPPLRRMNRFAHHSAPVGMTVHKYKNAI